MKNKVQKKQNNRANQIINPELVAFIKCGNIIQFSAYIKKALWYCEKKNNNYYILQKKFPFRKKNQCAGIVQDGQKENCYIVNKVAKIIVHNINYQQCDK
ncbi:MAG: hypothetical protein HDR35_10105 [Treponema sp.]|nr:hypothetical protein [Treponema sp.]